MNGKKTSLLYKFIITMIRVFYPKTEIVGLENLPCEASVFVANHTQMNGPIVCELYFPVERYTWCTGEMMHLKEVPSYAFRDFWQEKPKYIRWFYKILSYIIAPLSVCVFNNANTIGVYKDKRILTTYKESVYKLKSGASIVVFPEHNKEHNNIIYDFQKGFTDVAKLYYKRYGRELDFVPVYIAPVLKKAYIGKAIRYCAENPAEEERERICSYLMDEITDIAASLPLHTVVPYRNIPKKDYPVNIVNNEAQPRKESL